MTFNVPDVFGLIWPLVRHVNTLQIKYKVFTDRFYVKINCENFLSLCDLISGIYLKTCSKNPTDFKTQDVYLKLLQRIFYLKFCWCFWLPLWTQAVWASQLVSKDHDLASMLIYFKSNREKQLPCILSLFFNKNVCRLHDHEAMYLFVAT